MNTKGFTLIELMIVIAIIAIIAAIAIPNLREAQRNANETSAVTVMRQYLGAQGTYHRTDYDDDGVKEYASIIDQLYDWDEDVTNNDDPDDIGCAIKLVDAATAKAEYTDGYLDASGGAVAKPRSGYWFADHTADQFAAAFEVHADDADPVGYVNGYGLSGFADNYGRTGIKCFVINDEGTVYERVLEGLDFDDQTDLPLAFPDVDADNWILVGE